MPTPTRKENFDLNTATLTGTISRIWPSGKDIYCRLTLPGDSGNALTLRLPDGMAAGEPVSLYPEMNVQVSGYLSQNEYEESLGNAAKAAGVEVPDEIANILLKRVATRLDVTALEPAQPGEPVNLAQLQGVIIKTWVYRGRNFIRIACYDKFCPIIAGVGKNGFPRRKPHYVSVRLPETPPALKARQRVRIFGNLFVQVYAENLHETLVEGGQAALLQNPAFSGSEEKRIVRSALYLDALTLIALS